MASCRLRLSLTLGCLLVSASALALNGVIKRPFNNNSSVSLQASTSNLNRVFVKDDKITQHIAPQGTFVFDSQRSQDGSVYFKPIYPETPFTVFFATAKGRHFSALVVPVQSNGKTIELIPKQSTAPAVHWEKNSGYLTLLHNRLLALAQGKVMPSPVTHSKTVRYQNGLRVRLDQLAKVPPLTALIYRLSNAGKKPITLTERQFWRPGIRAVSLSQQTLAPHEHGELITLVSEVGQ